MTDSFTFSLTTSESEESDVRHLQPHGSVDDTHARESMDYDSDDKEEAHDDAAVDLYLRRLDQQEHSETAFSSAGGLLLLLLLVICVVLGTLVWYPRASLTPLQTPTRPDRLPEASRDRAGRRADEVGPSAGSDGPKGSLDDGDDSDSQSLDTADIVAMPPLVDPAAPVPASSAVMPVRWYAPFYSGGGYSSEAISFVASLQTFTKLSIFQQGGVRDEAFVTGLTSGQRQMLESLEQKQEPSPVDSVSVCHSMPMTWFRDDDEDGAYCPQPNARYTVGRAMFEGETLPEEWLAPLRKMDEIWVPSRFNVESFARSGVDPQRLRHIPEAVDTSFFDPHRVRPSHLFKNNSDAFRFLSVFRWEERKGWDVLIEAYLTEFTPADNTILYILTDEDVHSAAFRLRMAKYFAGLDFSHATGAGSGRQLPEMLFLPRAIPAAHMPAVYKGADAFVLPSRGEGWGRPHVEAMSMALPVIATNWSGPRDFMTPHNSYPLRIEGLVEAQDGRLRWAAPSVGHLRELMRRVVTHRAEARFKGAQARADMQSRFCPLCVARVVLAELERIKRLVEQRSKVEEMTHEASAHASAADNAAHLIHSHLSFQPEGPVDIP